MKFEAMFYQENTADFFGKVGLSWYGVVVFYSDGTGGMKHLYIHQIICNDSKQDRLAFFSMYDSLLAPIKRAITTTKHITAGHGLEAKMLLHSKTQDGKSLVDSHFASSLRHVFR